MHTLVPFPCQERPFAPRTKRWKGPCLYGPKVRKKNVVVSRGCCTEPKASNKPLPVLLTMAQGISRILVSPIRISNLGTIQNHYLTPAIRNSSQYSRSITIVAPSAVTWMQVKGTPTFASVTAGNHKPVNLLYTAGNFSKVCSACGKKEIQHTKWRLYNYT